MHWLWIGLGGGLGSVLRYAVSHSIQARAGAFPWGTLTVNVIGSFAIGLCYILIQQKLNANEMLRYFLLIGVLGGFTTFSTFSFETVNLIQSGFWYKAMFNIIASFSLCIISAFVGLYVGKGLGPA